MPSVPPAPPPTVIMPVSVPAPGHSAGHPGSASSAAATVKNVPVTLDTLIALRVLFHAQNRRFTLPLGELGASVLPGKIAGLLNIKADGAHYLELERFSDSASCFVALDSHQAYKSLFRAAKAKLKLRLRVIQVFLETPGPPFALHVADPSPKDKAPGATGCPKPSERTKSASDASGVPAQTLESNVSTTMPKHPVEAGDGAPVAGQGDAAAAHKSAPDPLPKTAASWTVTCNKCRRALPHEHYHCSICDGGDYDLCRSCVDGGAHCSGAQHWMVKRWVRGGQVLHSVTERIAAKKAADAMPGAFAGAEADKKPDGTAVPTLSAACEAPKESPPVDGIDTRSCNCCLEEFHEEAFVTCTTCEDYDLCMACCVNNKHGHHPGHGFEAVGANVTLSGLTLKLSLPGRNTRHEAYCDGCDKMIRGVRYKCLSCPDWDFCSACMPSAGTTHPKHRFVPVYEALASVRSPAVVHPGVQCDGPLCKSQRMSCIRGTRYKCAICPDVDFCAACEAIPSNTHNRTHPLIKFRTPVRGVSVTTTGSDRFGMPLGRMGDMRAARSTATETTPLPASDHAATQTHEVKTAAAVEKPATRARARNGLDAVDEQFEELKLDLSKAACRLKLVANAMTSDLGPSLKPTTEANGAISAAVAHCDAALSKAASAQLPSTKTSEALQAAFVCDLLPDGFKVPPNGSFIQCWTLRNCGPTSWPAGCNVGFVGGDNMFNVDNTRPATFGEVAQASSSPPLVHEVGVGQTVHFSVRLKAPARRGTALSYWRLKTASGMRFGPKLWCGVQVRSPHKVAGVAAAVSASSSPVPQDEPQVGSAASVGGNSTAKTEDEPKAEDESITDEEIAELAAKLSECVDLKDPPVVASAPVAASSAPASALSAPEDAAASSSVMVFPTLDKEPPAAGTHDSAPVSPGVVEVTSPLRSTAETVSETEMDDVTLDDAESVDLEGWSEGEVSTDDEYDILDVSDTETVV